jgi:hypothetical protein
VARLISTEGDGTVVLHAGPTGATAIPGLSLCNVIYDPRTKYSCPERAAYRVWLPGLPEDQPDILCPEHAALWRSRGHVERIASL